MFDPHFTPKGTQVEISAEALYARLKYRIMEKLQEEPYQNDEGIWIDPLPGRDLASLAGTILKMVKHENDLKRADDVQVKVVPIPALPPIRKEH